MFISQQPQPAGITFNLGKHQKIRGDLKGNCATEA
jgi:hypothetical protein